MMDREPDEMRNLGVVGICKEAYNILQLHIRLFLSLALTLVLPLGVVVFCHSLITHPLLKKIVWGMGQDCEEGWLVCH
jgi:hypothetical protein